LNRLTQTTVNVEIGSARGKLFPPPSTLVKLFSAQVHSENEFPQEVPPGKYFQQQIHSANYLLQEVHSGNDFHHEVHSEDGSSHALTYARDDELCVQNQKSQHRAGEPHSLKLLMLQNLSSYLPIIHHIYNTIILSQLISGTDWLGSVDGFPFTCSQYLHLQFTQTTRK